MPQMAPINWLNLFMMFNVIFLLFNIMNYYSNIYLPSKSKIINKNKMNSLTWKW
nr:ATP synthase F0 subunit 8 [Phyllomyza sp.]